MKQHFFIFLSLFFCLAFNISSQVGINTEEPTAMLDVDGDIRIRGVIDRQNADSENRFAKSDNAEHMVLVTDLDGRFYYDKSVVKTTFVRGGNRSGNISLISIAGTLLGWNKIAFNDIYFDDNSEFDVDNAEFVAKRAGIYAVYVQFETASLLSASASGVGVLTRKKSTDDITLEAEETFLNVSVLGSSVTPPTRKVFTIVNMEEGDALFFGSSGLSLSVQLKGGTNSYFTIFQIK